MKKYAYMDTVFTLSEDSEKNSRTLYVTHDRVGDYKGIVFAEFDDYFYQVSSGRGVKVSVEGGTTKSIEDAIKKVCDLLLQLRLGEELMADDNWKKAQEFLKGLPDET